MVREVLEEFHESHPDIRVFYTPDPDDLEDAMLADMQAGTAPDVFQGCCTFFPIWAQQGHTLDLRPFVEADLDQDTPSATGTRPSTTPSSRRTGGSTDCPSTTALWRSTSTKTSSTSTVSTTPTRPGTMTTIWPP
jgi:hypothetical protein